MERCLATRLDFYFFCGFDDIALPDHSTLCRFRNWLAQDDTLTRLLELINRQLTEKGLKIEKAPAAVIDATIIQTASGKQRQAVETDENGVPEPAEGSQQASCTYCCLKRQSVSR